MADGFKMTVDTRKLQQIAAQLPNGVKDLLAAAANEMAVDMQLGMHESPASGRTYGDHVASSPGNPPRPDTVELLASVTHTPQGNDTQIIHDQVDYGKYQELGTETIEARPWMKPVFEAWRNGKFNQFVDKFPLVR